MFLAVVAISLLGTAAAVPSSGTCMCFTGDAVNIRSTPCGATIVGQGFRGTCTRSQGRSSPCTLNGQAWVFWETERGWVASDFIGQHDENFCSGGGGSCSGVEIISRAAWGARAPRSRSWLSLPLRRTVVHHTVGAHCTTRSACEIQMRNIQSFHMNTNGWADIGYNWCVGEDGRAYEGRGWDVVGAHAGSANSRSHGICVFGNFMSVNANLAARNAIFNLIDCGRNNNSITRDSTVAGHRDVSATACPGDQLYNWLRGQPGYSPVV